jgi:hypothetical protein
MNRIIMTALLAMVCFFASGKKEVKPQWPDGSTISEWFTDTAKIDVKTLGKQYVITKYGVKNDPTILQTQQIQAVIDRCASEGGGIVIIPRGTFLTGAQLFRDKENTEYESQQCHAE